LVASIGSVAAGWTVRAGIVVEDVLVGEVIRVVKTCVEDAYRQAAVVERLDSLRVDPDTLGAAVHAESAQRAGFQRSIAGSSAEVSLDGKSPSSLDGVRFRVDDLEPEGTQSGVGASLTAAEAAVREGAAVIELAAVRNAGDTLASYKRLLNWT
jgi:hypothetical protein